MNLLDVDEAIGEGLGEDMFPLTLRLPGPSPIALSSSSSPPPSARVQDEHTASSRTRHIRATPSSRRTTPSLPRSLPPPPKQIRLSAAPFRQGHTPGRKPKAADYEDGVEKILLNAMHEYSCLILTADAFPHEVKQTQWAKATWQAACDDVGVNYECSVRIIRLVRLQCYCQLIELNVDMA